MNSLEAKLYNVTLVQNESGNVEILKNDKLILQQMIKKDDDQLAEYKTNDNEWFSPKRNRERN